MCKSTQEQGSDNEELPPVLCMAPTPWRKIVWSNPTPRLGSAGRVEFQFFGGRHPHIPGQSHRFQQADESVGKIEFPGAKSVARRGGKSVMIVVPAFSISHKGHPPAIGGEVGDIEVPIAEFVTGGVDRKSTRLN